MKIKAPGSGFGDNGEGFVRPILSTFIICCGCIVICFIFAMIHGSFSIPNSLKIWTNIFCLAVICTSLPILFKIHQF